MPKNHILKDKFDFWTQHGKNHDFWLFPKAFMMDLKTHHMLLFGVPRASGYPKIIKTSIFYHLITFFGWNLQFWTILIFAIFCLESPLFSSEKICEISKIHFFLNCVWSVFSKICHIILKIMIKKTCFWPHIPLNKQITLWILCRGSSCFLTPSQRYNFKCCFCCFCCVFGYHGVVFQNLHEK